MSETQTPTAAPAPVAPQPPPPPAPPAASPSAAEAQTFSRDYVHELREESKTWRQKAQGHESDAKTARTVAEEAKTNAETRIAEARAEADARVIRAEIKAHAVRAGMVDLDGLKLLDLSAIKLDDKGDVVIPETFFETAKTAKPWLFATQSEKPAQSSSTPAAPPPVANQSKKSAMEMSDSEFKSALKRIETTGRAS